MIYIDLLRKLDELRSTIRLDPVFQKTPRALVARASVVAEALSDLSAAVGDEQRPTTVTFELDADGKPIIPADLSDLFAIVPEEKVIISNEGARVQRRNPVEQPRTAKGDAAPKAVPLPRDTPRIEHPIDLQDADEKSVVK